MRKLFQKLLDYYEFASENGVDISIIQRKEMKMVLMIAVPDWF